LRFHFNFFIALAIIALPLTSFSTDSCENLFANKTISQRAINLFVQDKPANPVETKYFGFVTRFERDADGSIFSKIGYYVFDFVPHKLGYLITLDRNFSFTPLKGMEENLLNKPFSKLTKAATGKEKKMGVLIKLPLIALLTVSGWKYFDQNVFWPTAEREATQQIFTETERNASYYDHLIDTDLRFENIKNFRDKGSNIQNYVRNPKVNARVLAYGLKRSYTDYYEAFSHVDQPYKLTLQDNIELFGSNQLFQHLNFFFENGVKQYKGTYVPPKYLGPLSDKQKNTLFNLTHLLYTKYLLIDVLYSNGADVSELLKQNEMAKDIYNNNYSQQLRSLYNHHKISKDQLIYYTQEDAQDGYYMSLFQTLHITNLQFVNGHYINKPLTLEDLRKSRLATLE
jgi:hypothetical protein